MKVTDSRPDLTRLAKRYRRGGGRDDLVGREFGLVGKAGEWVSECGGKEEEEEDGCGELLAPLRPPPCEIAGSPSPLFISTSSDQGRRRQRRGGGGRLGDTFHNPRLIVSRIRTTKAFRPSERAEGGCDSV